MASQRRWHLVRHRTTTTGGQLAALLQIPVADEHGAKGGKDASRNADEEDLVNRFGVCL